MTTQMNIWLNNFDYLTDYLIKHNGDFNIPRELKTETTSLRAWVYSQRTKRKTNKLSSFQIAMLDELNFPWNGFSSIWYNNFLIAKDYSEHYDSLSIRSMFYYKQINLGCWLARQRRLYSLGKLDIFYINKLNSIGMVWDISKWDTYFNLAQEYFETNGNLRIHVDYSTQGYNLGRWVNTQRTHFKNNILPQNKIDKLESIGMIWTIRITKWDKYYELLRDYYLQNRTLHMPAHYVAKHTNLGEWFSKQKKLHSEKKLAPIYVEKLNVLSTNWNI